MQTFLQTRKLFLTSKIRQNLDHNKNMVWLLKARRNMNNNKITFVSNIKNFFGFEKFGSNYNTISKIFWIFSLLLSVGICAWQVYLSIAYYFSCPIGVSVTVEPIEDFYFPTMIVCPKSSKTTQQFNFTKPLIKRCIYGSNQSLLRVCIEEQNVFNLLNITTTDLWRDQQVHVLHEYTRNRKKRNISIGQHYHMDTHLGRCLVLYQERKFPFTGKGTTAWSIFVEGINTVGEKTSFDLVIAIRSSKQVNRYNTFGEVVKRHTYRYVEMISMKELSRVNTKQKPCLKEDENVQCLNQCFDLAFEGGNISCKLPYVNTQKLPLCSSMEEIANFQEFELEMEQHLKCNCARPCNTVLYTFETKLEERIIRTAYENGTIFTLVMWISFKDVVKEFHSYQFSQLLTDLAGNVGFFLGISLLKLFEIVHSTLTSQK